MKSSPVNRLFSCFTNLSLIIMFFVLGNSTLLGQSQQQPLTSQLKTIDVYTKEINIIYFAHDHFEAPNWTPDGQYLIFNSQGKLYRISLTGGKPALIQTGFADRCNNDHVLSPDGSHIAISHQSVEDGNSRIYVTPITGGIPQLITKNGPSYLHGWSPDGKHLAYCAQRNGEYDVYTISIDMGEEVQLTSEPGLDDGPDYSPDGLYIYFNSVRTGTMQIWRMLTDGSEQTQLTFDEKNDWFPHPSPDGKWLVFLSYEPEVDGHPANKQVELRMMPVNGGEPVTLVKLFGGQGTINVPSWSPDSKKVAFVEYQIEKE